MNKLITISEIPTRKDEFEFSCKSDSNSLIPINKDKYRKEINRNPFHHKAMNTVDLKSAEILEISFSDCLHEPSSPSISECNDDKPINKLPQ